DLHFAPTERARRNLVAEGVTADRIFVTGNTIVDALRLAPVDSPFDDPALENIDFQARRIILVTAHRRENHGAPLVRICQALKEIARMFPEVEVVLPVHLNPAVSGTIHEHLGSEPRIHLLAPLSYFDL